MVFVPSINGINIQLEPMQDDTSKNIEFEELPLGLLMQIRKHLRFFDYVELRKASKSWDEVEKESQIYVIVTPDIEVVRDSIFLQDWNHVWLAPWHSGILRNNVEEVLSLIGPGIKYFRSHVVMPIAKLRAMMPNLVQLGITAVPLESVHLYGLPRVENATNVLVLSFVARVLQERIIFQKFIFEGGVSGRFDLTENSDSITALLAAASERLEYLGIRLYTDCNFLLNSQWIDTVSKLRKLTSLSLHMRSLQLARLFVEHLPEALNMTRLQVFGHRDNTELTRLAFSRWGDTLQHFECERLERSAVTHLQHGVKLTSLHLIHTLITPRNLLNSLASVVRTNLRKLKLVFVAEPQLFTELLAVLPNLDSLVLVTGGMRVDILPTIFQHQTKLVNLVLFNGENVNDLNSFANIHRMQQLEGLTLGALHCDSATAHLIFERIFNLPELRKLRLPDEMQKLAWEHKREGITAELRHYLQCSLQYKLY